MKNGQRPTGIIRTLPYFGAGDTEEAGARRLAYKRMMEAFRRADRYENAFVRIAFSQKPTTEVLHCYILVGGRVRLRANISHWEAGSGAAVESWDGHDLSKAKYWAILTGPVSYPPEPVKMRGSQGFRYTEELW
jgi:hypothetical protein